jgi:hypothetical protein
MQVGDITTFKWMHGAEDPNTFKWSFSFWCKVVDMGDVHPILDTGGWVSSGKGVYVRLNTNGSIVLDIARGFAFPNEVCDFSSNPGDFPLDGAWHNVVITYDQEIAANNAKVYVDGTLVFQYNKTGLAPWTGDPNTIMYFGASVPGNQYGNCYVEDYRFYKDIVLSADEVKVIGRDRGHDVIVGEQRRGTLYGNAQIDNSVYKFGSGSFKNPASGLMHFTDSDDWRFSNGNWTVDLWARFNSLPIDTAAMDFVSYYDYNTSNRCWHVRIYNDGGNIKLDTTYSTTGVDANTNFGSGVSLSLNTWYHFAFVRDGNVLRYFLNGVAVGTAVVTATFYNAQSCLLVGAMGSPTVNAYPIDGYIDEVRISKGIARWTTNFAPPSAPYQTDSYTKLLLHFDTTEAFKDDTGKVLTKVGGVIQDYTQAVFCGASYRFDGTTDYITVPDSADWYLGVGDFTLDMWIKLNSMVINSQGIWLIGQWESGIKDWCFRLIRDATNDYHLYFASEDGLGNNIEIIGNLISPTPALNTWHHIVLTRSGNTFRFFFDGVAAGSGTDSDAMIDLVSVLYIGADNVGARCLDGWLDEIRISKGIARWTSAFTVPTQPHVKDEYTVLLLHSYREALDDSSTQKGLWARYKFADGYDGEPAGKDVLLLHCDGSDGANDFVDSATGKIVTAVGNAKMIQGINKFGLSSAKFNGSNDYLSLADSADWYFTGDFTIDLFVRFRAFPANNYDAAIFWQKQDNSNGQYFALFNNGGTPRWDFWQNVGGVAVIFMQISDASLALNTWYHIAFVRYGNIYRVFRDGVKLGSDYTNATASVDFVGGITIGGDVDLTYPLSGYIDEYRVTKGAARWTGNFTPPHQAYFTEIAETSGRGLNTFVSSASAPRFRSGELSMKRRYRR